MGHGQAGNAALEEGYQVFQPAIHGMASFNGVDAGDRAVSPLRQDGLQVGQRTRHPGHRTPSGRINRSDDRLFHLIQHLLRHLEIGPPVDFLPQARHQNAQVGKRRELLDNAALRGLLHGEKDIHPGLFQLREIGAHAERVEGAPRSVKAVGKHAVE